MTTSATSRKILLATAVAGTLDILSACVYTTIAGHTPLQMLRGISSAILGEKTDGILAPLIGLALHFAIMAVMAAVFILAAQRLVMLRERAIAAGLGYGLVTWAVMNLIVLPLRWPEVFPKFGALGTSEQLFSHIVLVGIPIALIARRTP